MSKLTQTPEYTDFFEEIPTPEVAAPTAEPVTEAPTISEDAPTPEVETPAADEQQIPKARFDKVYAEHKESQRKLEELQNTVKELQSKDAPAPVVEDDMPLDSDAEKAIKQLLKREGYDESKTEIARLREEIQLEKATTALNSDAKDLSGWAKEQGYPDFKLDAVNEYAKENGIVISSKAALKSAYLTQNMEAIITASVKRGVTSATETPKATVEKPGAATGKAPSPADSGPKTIQERIRAAMPQV